MRLRWAVIVWAATALIACGDDDSNEGGDGLIAGTEVSDIEGGCNHFEFGPHEPLAAAMGADAPMSIPHKHFTISIPADGGMVNFAPPSAGAYIIMLSADVSLSVQMHGGDTVEPLNSESPGSVCKAAGMIHRFEFMAHPHMFTLSGSSSVEMVIHGPLGGEHHHMNDMGGHHMADAGM